MKLNTIKLLFLSTALLIYATAFGQFNKEKWKPYTTEQKKEFFKQAIKKGEFNDDIFEITNVPTKWKDESIVILAKKQWYTGYVNNWNNVAYYTYKARVRFKLQDLSAVEGFSTYYFENDEIIEITIEKPDGTRTRVDEDEAIEVSEEVTVPYFGKINVNNTKKIAFENLEPGDILDVTIMDKEKHIKNALHWTDPLTFFIWFITPMKVGASVLINISDPFSYAGTVPLNTDYPIVEQKIDFDLGKHFYLNFRSINGAPELEEAASKKRKRKHWVFHDVMREKLKDEAWSEPLASLPAIKYELHFMNKRTRRKTDKIINKKERLNTEVNDKDLKKIAHAFIKESKKANGDLYYHFYKKGKKIKGDREFIDAFYNHYRTTKLYEIARRSNKPVYDASVSNAPFVGYMIKILRKRMIPYTLIMGVPREEGGLEGLISRNDLIWGVKVKYGNDDVIYTDCDLYAEPGDVNPIFEGITLYEVTPSWWRGGYKIYETDIPVSSPKKNQFIYKITAEFQEDLDTLKVKRETHLTGMARYRYKSETFPYHTYYQKLKDELNYDYNFARPFLYEKSLLRDKYFLESEDERLTQSVLNRRAYFTKRSIKRDIKRDYQLADYSKLEVKQDGLDTENPDMVYTEEFRLLDLMNEAGNGAYILKVGEFIDGQIEIKDKEERERQNAILFPYARTYIYEIKITIPALMKVVGIDALNKNISNEVGSFRSTANLNNSILSVRVEKSYKGIYHDKAKWSELLEFVDEAVDFRSIKVILKRQ